MFLSNEKGRFNCLYRAVKNIYCFVGAASHYDKSCGNYAGEVDENVMLKVDWALAVSVEIEHLIKAI